MLAIRVAGREILGHPRDLSRANGLFVRPGGFQGWSGVANTRRESLARAVQHGEHDTPVYLGSRVVTVDGWALAPTERELVHLCESVSGLLASGRTKVTIDHRGQTLWADARTTSAECDDLGSSSSPFRAEFQLQLTFADPRRYGEEHAAPLAGSARGPWVSHRGNFPAYPAIEIPNAPSDYSISSPGGTFSIAGATAGGTHTVDLRSGRVFRDGVEMIDVGRGSLWAIPPGVRWQHALSVPGIVRVTDTYV